MNSASLCSLAGRYDNPIPLGFLAPIDFLKIPVLFFPTNQPLYLDPGCKGIFNIINLYKYIFLELLLKHGKVKTLKLKVYQTYLIQLRLILSYNFQWIKCEKKNKTTEGNIFSDSKLFVLFTRSGIIWKGIEPALLLSN